MGKPSGHGEYRVFEMTHRTLSGTQSASHDPSHSSVSDSSSTMKRGEAKNFLRIRIAMIFGVFSLIVSIGFLITSLVYYFHMQDALKRVSDQLRSEMHSLKFPNSNESTSSVSVVPRFSSVQSIYDVQALTADIQKLKQAQSNYSESLAIEMKRLDDTDIKLMAKINLLNQADVNQSNEMKTSVEKVNEQYQQLYSNLSTQIEDFKRANEKELLRIASQLDDLEQADSNRSEEVSLKLEKLNDADTKNSAALMREAVERIRQDSLLTKQFQEQLRQLQANQSAASGQLTKMSTKIDQNEAKIGTFTSIQTDVNKLSSLINRLATGWRGDSSTILYKRFYESVTYQTAKTRCRGLGGRLAAKVLRDQTLARDIVRTGYIPGSASLWIGYDDITSERRWRWADGGSTNRATTGWNPGEPNNSNGGEDCAEATTSKGMIKLNDLSCRSERGYLCEIDLKQ